VGVNFSNFQFSDVNRFKAPTGFIPGLTNGLNGGAVPIPITGGLAGASRGVPLYKDGLLVGGLGVAGDEETDSAGNPLPLPPRVDAATLAAVPELAIAPSLVRLPDVDEAVARAMDLANSGTVETLCVHGDGPTAVAILRKLRTALEADGLTIHHQLRDRS
jgi:hypothetical protein